MTADTLDRIRAGDEAALDGLLRAHWAGLVRFLRHRLEDPDQAEDAAQEAFVRLWERRERWEGDSAQALLYRIGLNVAADLGRKAVVRDRFRRSEAATASSFGPSPDEHVEVSEARARFLVAFESLPPKRKQVFHLVRDDALSYREVAEIMGLSVQTVANHMSLALRELREALADVLPTGLKPAPPTGQEVQRDG